MAIDFAGNDDLYNIEPGTKLPCVGWTEDRPNGTQVWVSCYIGQGANRELMFGSDGGLIGDRLYRLRPWEKLVGFRFVTADELYYDQRHRRVRQEFMNQSIFYRLVLPNDGMVMLADFYDENASIPVHINYCRASVTELTQLHNLLQHYFIGQRQEIVNHEFGGEFRVPHNFGYALTSESYLQGMKGDFFSGKSITKPERKKGFFGKLFG